MTLTELFTKYHTMSEEDKAQLSPEAQQVLFALVELEAFEPEQKDMSKFIRVGAADVLLPVRESELNANIKTYHVDVEALNELGMSDFTRNQFKAYLTRLCESSTVSTPSYFPMNVRITNADGTPYGGVSGMHGVTTW